jgi:hypothetical protein
MSFGGKDNRGPSIAELQKYIREKVDMLFILNTGENIIGKLRWFDENAFSVAQDGQQPFTILRSAVVGYRKHSGDSLPQSSTASRGQEAVVGASQTHAQEMVSDQQNQQVQPAAASTTTEETSPTEDSGA